LKAEIHLYENDKMDIEKEILNKEKNAKERILPDIERTARLIAEMNAEIANGNLRIEKVEQANAEEELKLLNMEKEKEEFKDKIELLQ
jgi:chromosome segregation ATPase